MSLTRKNLEELIKQEEFTEIFLYSSLGWDQAERARPLPIDVKFADINYHFDIKYIAQKRGFVICWTKCDTMPTKEVRRKLERKLSRIHYEHILILSAEDGEQKWIISHKLDNKPINLFETGFVAGQTPEAVMQKLNGLAFSMSEENTLDIAGVAVRAVEAFATNTEEVTRKFYERFRKELVQFQNFICGLQEQIDKEQYAALMLNRLMFIYFIQKKEFLDGDADYLNKRLEDSKQQLGKDKFYKGFYRQFLRELFFRGLGAPIESRTSKVKKLIGEVPYLNGGLFDQHALEKKYDEEIDITDNAFDKLFKFFDEYNWYLDNRRTASGNDINPDVIGYIFEKYINERAEMGAYYTQEDITGYIARNTILPYLLQQTEKKCAGAFDKESGTIWKLLRNNPAKYIYEHAKHGCDSDIKMPDDIICGLDSTAPDLLTKRKKWKELADEELALPTESWRETIARRQRFFALKEKLESGKINNIAALITHNLDIEQLTYDALKQHEDSDFITAFYTTIAGRPKREGENTKLRRGISVLDPACGSGAFLFAALGVLEQLYTTCINRMQEFVDDDDVASKKNKQKIGQVFFRDVLDEIATHKNKKYWIYRNIILGNLFGVDFMPEAVEVAKLRLFLKLAAAAEMDREKPNMGLDPLPDIDFNIRAGNSLVGFASMEKFEEKAKRELDLSDGVIDEVKTEIKMVGMAHSRFIEAQTETEEQGVKSKIGCAIKDKDFKSHKEDLTTALYALNQKLSKYLAQDYGKEKANDIEDWKVSYKPFHWVAEFYEIMRGDKKEGEKGGGFDVIIGNPPYVGYSLELQKQYTVREYKTESCKDLYAFFVERAKYLISNSSSMSMIIPCPAFSTDRMVPLVEELKSMNNDIYVSFYSVDPSKLFADAKQRLAIYLSISAKQGDIKTTNYMKWYSKYRECLFDTIVYSPIVDIKNISTMPKFKADIELSIIRKMQTQKTLSSFLANKNKHVVYYHNAPSFWTRAHIRDYIPYFRSERDDKRMSTQMKSLYTRDDCVVSLCALINSSLFYWWFVVMSDCRHLNNREINNFPINLEVFHKTHSQKLVSLVAQLMANYRDNATRKITVYRTTGTVIYDEIHPRSGKLIIDEIDKVLAKHYNFSEEELDYIINYDYKYRMGVAG